MLLNKLFCFFKGKAFAVVMEMIIRNEEREFFQVSLKAFNVEYLKRIILLCSHKSMRRTFQSNLTSLVNGSKISQSALKIQVNRKQKHF
jgi:hypothetical protein